MAIEVKPYNFLVDKHGRTKAVVLLISDYKKLMRLVEDRDDARTLKRAIRTSKTTVSHAELTKRLKKQGLL